MSEMEPEIEEETPDLDYADFDIAPEPLMIHGILAPEAAASGDNRGFMDNAVTRRPLRLPFGWQEWTAAGHDSSITVGGIDRMMRKDGMVHFEGALMSSWKADEFVDLLSFFGRYGVSIDGVKGEVDEQKSTDEGMVWFDAVQIAGAVACSIPAFAEAYVSLGPHPDMPEGDDAMAASGDLIGAQTFKRGPGWVTNPKETKRIYDYWTKPGQPGYAKIRWGTRGDFTRAKALIGEKIAKNSPDKMRFLNQIIAQWHHDVLGYWPGDLDMPGNKTSAEARAEREAKASADDITARDVSPDERKKLAEENKAMPDGSYPIANADDLRNAIQAIGRAKDPAAAKAHIRKRASALGLSDLIPEQWGAEGSIEVSEELFEEADEAGRLTRVGEREDGAVLYDLAPAEGIETDDIGQGWEAVLVSSAGVRVAPPAAYFTKHPDTGALVIEEPDADGIRRTYGYAGEWGVCHIGRDGRCVEVPEPTDGKFSEFHLGRTKVSTPKGAKGYLNTGVITYKVDHRDAITILSESAEQQHYDNIAHAWAAVSLGTDDRGIWFSGVVLPGVSDEDCTLIEATGQVSGEWKYGALRALQAVNVPGFPVLRSSAEYGDDGSVIALVASTFGRTTDGCEPTPIERMAALAAADAEVRFQKLREEWV